MPPEDVLAMKTGQKSFDSREMEEQWDLSGSLIECIKRYSEKLSEEELNEIILGIEQGLTERQIKSYFQYPAKKMEQYRNSYLMITKERV